MNLRTVVVHRVRIRFGVVLAAAAVTTVMMPSIAAAHVTVNPGELEGGGFSVVSFRVPTERENASTTKLQVILPEDQPLGSVRTTPVPGWKVETKTRELDEPIEFFGEQLDTVVSQITWTATGRGVPPEQFVDFDVSLGQLPESGEMVFKALQTYSSGEQVNWTEVSLDESVEPEHPAPVLSLTPPADVAEESPATAGVSDEVAETTSTLPIVLSAAALAVALAALLLAWRRSRA